MENKDPLISIVSVVLNAEDFIEDLIKSILSQKYQSFEFIIVDGGSTDDTINIIKTYSNNIDKWISEKDQGIYDAMNKGIEIAKGEWIYFIGADDQLLPNSISKTASYLTDKNTIYYGNVIMPARKRVYDGKFSLFKLANRNLPHQAQFYPKNLWKSYKFSTNYKIYGDYELNLKIVGDPRFRLKYIPVTVARFNDFSGMSTIGHDDTFEKIKWALVRKNFPFLPFFLGYLRYCLIQIFRGLNLYHFIKGLYHSVLRLKRPIKLDKKRNYYD